MRSDIAVIGDVASVIGFKAAGFKTFAAEGSAEIAAAVEALVRDRCAVIFITEQALEGAEDVLNAYRDRSVPAIIPIPGRFGKIGIGARNLSRNVERAIGTDILSGR